MNVQSGTIGVKRSIAAENTTEGERIEEIGETEVAQIEATAPTENDKMICVIYTVIKITTTNPVTEDSPWL